jgi:hypothetical protein
VDPTAAVRTVSFLSAQQRRLVARTSKVNLEIDLSPSLALVPFTRSPGTLRQSIQLQQKHPLQSLPRPALLSTLILALSPVQAMTSNPPTTPPVESVDTPPRSEVVSRPFPSRQRKRASKSDDEDDFDDTFGCVLHSASSGSDEDESVRVDSVEGTGDKRKIKREKRPFFFPPLWLARRTYIAELLKAEGVASVRPLFTSTVLVD